MPLADARGSFPARVPAPAKRRLGKRDQPPVDADAVLHELQDETVRILARVLGVGGALQFGSTRSRGALLVRAWIDGDQYEDYVTSVAELTATYEALDDVVEAVARRGLRA